MMPKFLTMLSIGLIGFCCSSLSLASFLTANQTASSTRSAVVSQPIIAYFDSIENDNNYIEDPSSDGFYRVLLDQNADGHFLIQDYFQNTAQAQTAPYWVTSLEGLTSFSIDYVDGPLVGYFRNGNMSFQGNLHNGEYTTPFESYYPSGLLANRTSSLAAGYTQDEYFYENGETAVLYEYNADGERVKIQAWDKKGKRLPEDQATEIESVILEAIRFDR